MIRLTPRDRRASLIGGIVLAAALILGRGVPSWLAELARVRDQSAFEARALADARAVILAAAALGDSLRQRRAAFLAHVPALIAESNANVAVARLEAAVSGAALSAGIAVSTLDLKADSAVGRVLGRPRVRGEARGDISGLMQFLLLLELGPPFLRVATMTVTQPDPVSRGGRAEELRISFVIEGASLGSNPMATADGVR